VTGSKRSLAGSALELVLIVAGALALALGIQAFVVKPYRIPSGSMEPTLHINQRILANRLINHPSLGDIVVFHPPAGALQGNGVCGNPSQGVGHPQPCDEPTTQESSTTFIKLVVGLPGDRISITGGHVYRNGVREKDSYIEPCGDAPGLHLLEDDRRSARRLLHDGGQPWRFRRQPLLGARA
jgi:signal peptidase I